MTISDHNSADWHVLSGKSVPQSLEVEFGEAFRQFFAGSPDAAILAFANGTIAVINSAAETLFGYSTQELSGCPVDALRSERRRGDDNDRRAENLAARQVRPTGFTATFHG